MRGNHRPLPRRRRLPGSIPARAGEPSSRRACRRLLPVYPRACGGTSDLDVTPDDTRGLSPRVRGNRVADPEAFVAKGSIPARAGEPEGGSSLPAGGTVYPRACGGTTMMAVIGYFFPGLSPRVRGNPRRPDSLKPPAGSIPARAGEPPNPHHHPDHRGVYPRACGGTVLVRIPTDLVHGLSPRVRGNLAQRGFADVQLGSIPARAGEPARRCAECSADMVYPRACGGTVLRTAYINKAAGLSPRVRGNRAGQRVAGVGVGSIPARAGEPTWIGLLGSSCVVYPRACGGTVEQRWQILDREGLSPRVRGNQPPAADAGSGRGSIPARAGEPRVVAQRDGQHGVYPRACGGTRGTPSLASPARGLSPRVRGNPKGVPDEQAEKGSIPARAGEPSPAVTRELPGRVYPRACGGTQNRANMLIAAGGLSPRVRGNHLVLHPPHPRLGSIPARAGEPIRSHARRRAARVYPRACGGTAAKAERHRPLQGLSPRVRGNRCRRSPRWLSRWSIPARAGEPSR